METRCGHLHLETFTGPASHEERFGTRRCIQVTDTVNASFVQLNIAETEELVRALRRIARD